MKDQIAKQLYESMQKCLNDDCTVDLSSVHDFYVLTVNRDNLTLMSAIIKDTYVIVESAEVLVEAAFPNTLVVDIQNLKYEFDTLAKAVNQFDDIINKLNSDDFLLEADTEDDFRWTIKYEDYAEFKVMVTVTGIKMNLVLKRNTQIDSMLLIELATFAKKYNAVLTVSYHNSMLDDNTEESRSFVEE